MSLCFGLSCLLRLLSVLFVWTVTQHQYFGCVDNHHRIPAVVSSFVPVARLRHHHHWDYNVFHRKSIQEKLLDDSPQPRSQQHRSYPAMAVGKTLGSDNDAFTPHTIDKKHSSPKHIGMPASKKSWQVWKTIDRLQQVLTEHTSTNEPFPLYPSSPELVGRITEILRQLATLHEGKSEWQGLLNKSTLLHEVEESILAIHFLQEEWKRSGTTTTTTTSKVVLVDVCCGKGVFSLLASYYFNSKDDNIHKIIMLDKDPKLRWDHIHASNQELDHHRPFIETWPRFNLHEADQVVARLEAEIDTNATLAMVGIHLCKTLSPTCIGIANLLGPRACPHLILAPCCLPRVVVQSKPNAVVEIRQHETKLQHSERLVAKERRSRAMVRKSDNNNLAACWKCGEFGHVKADCPSNQSTGKPQLVRPPTISLQVSGIFDNDRPFGSYCELLSTSIQRESVRVEETGLTNGHNTNTKKQDTKQEANNWNRDRKSMYIVASEGTSN